MLSAPAPSRVSMIFSGVVFDGSAPDRPAILDVEGTRFVARVRAMPARHLGTILNRATDESGTIAFTTSYWGQISEGPESTPVEGWIDASDAWVDNLSPESHLELYEAAKRLNFTRAAAWAERQITAKTEVAPLILKGNRALVPMTDEMVGLILSSLESRGLLAKPSTPSSTTTPSTS